MNVNVFGEPLIPCCYEPVTGFYRDGYCRIEESDGSLHTVCAVMTEEFLLFSLEQGNDLISPVPNGLFPGLKPGDKWCLSVLRWREAYEHGAAPPVILEACNELALEYVDISMLIEHSH